MLSSSSHRSSHRSSHHRRTSSGNEVHHHNANQPHGSTDQPETPVPAPRRRSSQSTRERLEEEHRIETPRTAATSTRHGSHRHRRSTTTRPANLRIERRKRKSHATVRQHSAVSGATKSSVRPNHESRKTGHARNHAAPQSNRISSTHKKPDATERGAVGRKKEIQQSPDLLSTIFGSPKPTQPERKVTCLTCLSDDIPVSRSAKLACSHRMCHSCLKRIFTLSVTDPQHMPPKCCTSDPIPLKHVEKLFDMKFKVKWNRKYQEFTTKNRIYCPTKGCGKWIEPSRIRSGVGFGFGSSGDGRKTAKCSWCRTKICCACKGKWHASKTCPDDEETKKFIAMAQQKGWQRCYNCSAIVELKEGCNHMTCRCTAEFCMICGSKWKTCDCPWFNYNLEEDDQFNYLNLPRFVNIADNLNRRARANEIPRRQDQFQLPQDFFREFQLLDIGHNNHQPAVERRDGHHVLVFGNANEHFLNEHFIPQRHERRPY